MITERQEEMATLHALGLLDGADKSSFEAELGRNAALRAVHDQLVATAATMALAAPQIEPPAALKAKVLAACSDRVPDADPPPSPAGVVHLPVTRFIPWAAAAALMVSTLWFARQTITLRDENANLRTERQLAEVAYRMAQNQLSQRSLVAEKMINNLGEKLRHSEDLARLKITALASLAGNTKAAQVIAVWDPEQQAGLLTMEKLPAIAENQDYQIWIVDPAQPNPINGGVFHVAADGKIVKPFWPDQPVTKAAAFAISVEKKGGVSKAEGPIVLLGK